MELQGKRILLVEDDDFMADLVIHYVVEAGAKCEWAKDGAEGIKKLGEGTFDLILTDLLMSGMNGVEMLEKIRAIEEYKEIPILVLTNRTNSDAEVQQASKFGVTGFFAKSSTSLTELVARIARILEK